MAFRASRLVCSAIWVIDFTTSPICLDETPSSPMVAEVTLAISTALPATRAACEAFWAISRIEAPICSAPAATPDTLVETWVAAEDTTPACAEVSSEAATTWASAAESSSDDEATAWAVVTTSAISPRSCDSAPASARAISPSSSRARTVGSTVRSPVDIASIDRLTVTTERSTPADTTSPRPRTATAPSATVITVSTIARDAVASALAATPSIRATTWCWISPSRPIRFWPAAAAPPVRIAEDISRSSATAASRVSPPISAT